MADTDKPTCTGAAPADVTPEEPVCTGAAPAGGTPDEPVLPALTRDELDVGWGDERTASQRDDEWYLRERPPHHD